MPGNEVEDGIFNVYDVDNSSYNHHIPHLSRAFGGIWSVPDYNHWVGKPIQIGGPPNSNLKNRILQPLDFVKGHDVESLHTPLNQNCTQWNPSLSIRNPNTNEPLIGQQNFLLNPNKAGVYGGSGCFNNQTLNSGGFSIFKSQPENECADSPTLTTNSERSEITEASSDYNFHRGQLQIARDIEANNSKPQTMQQPEYNDMQVLQQHMMFKQLQEFQRQLQLGEQSPLDQLSVQFPPLINGTPVQDPTHMPRNWMLRGVSNNKPIFPQEQGQALHSIGLSQENDVSLYDNARANTSHYPHFQGMAYDSVSVSQMKSTLVQLPVQGLNSGIFPGNLQEQTEQFGSCSEELVPLDPMEAKILYNMDENMWDAFGSRHDTEAAALDNPDSIQCGTWSALMQSAVAETSSSDTALQEWSGLTFQNRDQPTVDFSSFVDSEKQQPVWVGTSSTFPGFHQPGTQFLAKQREDFGNDNYNPQKATVQDGEKGQQPVHSSNIWAGQMFEHSLSASKHKKGVSSGISIDKGAYESQEELQNSNVTLKGLTSHEKGHERHLKSFGNFSSSAMNVDKGSIRNYQPSPIASEEVPSRGDHGSNASTSYRSSNIAEQTRLSLSSAKLANPNTTLLAINDLNSTQVNAELGENSEPSQTPFSFNSFLQSHELAQRTHQEQMQITVSHHPNLSGMTQQGENSARPFNVWRNVPTQRQHITNIPSSMDSANNKTAEGSTSSNIQGYGHGEEHISQFFLGKPSQNLHIKSHFERVDGVAAGQDGRVWPSASAALVSSGHVSSLEATNQVAAMKPKKRKFMALELVPWHKEVMRETESPQNMSAAEQDWARATNRLIEKVDDEVEMIQDLQPKHRSKRRLLQTTQLVQQLLRVGPASIFSADAATNYSIISYFVSRLSLSDTCSFSYCSLRNSNTSSEKPKSECNTERCLEVVNSFSDRAMQLENELERLDKTASITIIRAEIQELERFTVINRFAKFHVRGQTDVPKMSPQRYIVAIPMPKYLPEGVQCLSL